MTRASNGGTGILRADLRRSSGRTLVVGLGSAQRGDDSVGPEVVRAVDGLGLADVDLLVHEDPTDLVELWSSYDSVVVVDAVCSGAPPGRVCVLETGAGLDPLPEGAWRRTGRGGTHAFGLAAAVELARALHRLPALVTVVGVEAQSFDHGTALSPAVEAAVPAATDVVARAVHDHGSAGSAPGRGAGHVSR
jgi:hydrogenase maturation protease